MIVAVNWTCSWNEQTSSTYTLWLGTTLVEARLKTREVGEFGGEQ
jgi:hypothetical protein